MDSTPAEAAPSEHTYYLFRDARGTAHMVDRLNEVPARATQVQRVTVPGKDATPPSALNTLREATLGRMGHWLPASVQQNLARTHMTWNAAGAVLLLLFFFIRFQTFRSLMLKVTIPLALVTIGIGGFMSYRHRHSGAALAQGFSEAQRDADALRRGLRTQDRLMQQVEAGGPQSK